MDITGTWTKISKLNCGEKYPEKITFRKNGLYQGEDSAYKAMHTVWDVGTFEIVKESLIKMSTSNDAIISYQISLKNKKLSFKDDAGCVTEYEMSN